MLKDLFFSKVLGAILSANWLCLVLLNFFEAPVNWIQWLYPTTLIAFLALFRACRPRHQAGTWDFWSVLMAGGTLILLTLPRLTYPLDWLSGNHTLVMSDDFARLAELISLTQSDRYPLRFFAHPDHLFSFYYTALYPLAWLKSMVAFLTLKDVIFLGNLLYHSLILGSLLEIAHLFFAEVWSIRLFVFLTTLFGGLDWLSAPKKIIGHYEWWQMTFEGNTQIPSFFNSLFWTIHHFVGFWGCVLALVFLFYCRSQKRQLKAILAVILLSSSCYSSIFSIFFLPLLLLIHYQVVWRKLLATWFFPLIFFMNLVPAFLFFGKPGAVSFVKSTFYVDFTGIFWLDKILSLPIFFTLIPLVEYAGIPFFFFFVFSRLASFEKKQLFFWLTSFATTYVLAFSGSNNISMRGMALPSFVLFTIFARHFPRFFRNCRQQTELGRVPTTFAWGVIGLLFLASIGTGKEAINRIRVSLKNASMSAPWLGETFPEWAKKYKTISRTSSIKQYQPGPEDRKSEKKYNAEKFIEGLPLSELDEWELELMRSPRQGFFL